jgi:hypothetical protein
MSLAAPGMLDQLHTAPEQARRHKRVLIPLLILLEVGVSAWATAHHAAAGVALLMIIVCAFLLIASILIEWRVVYLSGSFKNHFLSSLVLFAPMMLISIIFKMPVPSWYPTQNALWAAVPWLSFGALTALRGWSKLRPPAEP